MAGPIAKKLSVARILLDMKNPRKVGGFNDQLQAIEYLTRIGNIFELAKDITKNGLNPLERFAIIANADSTFTAIEGNRRLTALKLLTDPQLAPEGQRQRFEKISQNFDPIKEVDVILFPDRESVDIWLDRIHNGKNQGLGRIPWPPEAKDARQNTITSKFWGYAQRIGLINPDNKSEADKYTIFKEYMAKPDFRDLLGIDISNEGLETHINRQSFDNAFAHFFHLIKIGEISTRDNRTAEHTPKILEKIKTEVDYTGTYNSPIMLADDETLLDPASTDQTEQKPSKSRAPQPPTKIPRSAEIESALKELNNYKLKTLYYSLFTVSAKSHTLLINIGIWCFMECLSNAANFLNAKKLKNHFDERGFEKLGVSWQEKKQ